VAFRSFRLSFVSLAILFAAASFAHAQTAGQPAPAASTHRVPQFENDAVKVWRTIIEPGTPLPLHHHDHPRVLVALSPGTLKIVEQSGATQTIELKVGEAYWLPAMPAGALHQDVNASGQPIEVMVVELGKEK
jgi:beta-alanine degradation protein BauB